MIRNCAIPISSLAVLLLTGCAMPTADFPSLQHRPIEDLPVDDQPVARDNGPEIIAMPDALRQAMTSELQNGYAANAAFYDALPLTRAAVSRGASAGKNSENWVVAQSEVSALTVHTDRTANALSTLDAMYIGETEKNHGREAIYNLMPLIEARNDLQKLVANQQSVVTGLNNQLR